MVSSQRALQRKNRSRICRWLRRSLLVIPLLWLILSIWQAPVVQLKKAESQELRGIWMTNLGAALMYYTTRLDEVVANLAKQRLNTLYPAVWNRGYTLHPSSIAKQAGGAFQSSLNSLSFVPYQDVLAGLVAQAHRQHLRLIPWFEHGLMIPVNSAIARNHPDWLTATRQGKKVANLNPPGNHLQKLLWNFRQALSAGEQAWLNPSHPEVQQFLTNLIADVVKRYSVDGIQLDDHFSLPIDFGYDPYTVQLYRKTHGGRNPPNDPANPEWMTWRAAQLTQLMSKIAKAVKTVRPSAVVSLSPNAPDFAYRTSLQDWTHWVELGLLDEVVVQVYRDDLAGLKAELNSDRLRSVRSAVPVSIGLYTGPFLAAKPMPKLEKEIAAVRAADYNGVSFFCWETTLWIFKGSPNTLIDKTFHQLFPTASKAPNS
jgi:uncharacterized lipoprotein YddW (UPF0748 family)